MKRRLFTVVGAMLLAGLMTAAPSNARADHSEGDGSVSCNDGTVSYDPTTLWPPNHRMQTINITYADAENSSDTVQITVDAVTHDQFLSDGTELNGAGNTPVDSEGIGNTDTAPDGEDASTTAGVRAERSGRDQTGRTYTITVTCNDYVVNDSGVAVPDVTETDSEGNATLGTQTVSFDVFVPHDQRVNSVQF